MIIEDRYYQIEAENAVFDYWAQGGGNPLVEMATGTGKSVVIGRVNKRLLTDYQGVRVLMLTHVRELVAQNAQALLRVWPSAPIGINSAGLGKRDRYSPILFASVQSIYSIADQLGPRDVVMVDECDRIPTDGAGMYRQALDMLRKERPDLRVVGYTATPYRLDYGRIDEGKDRLFDKTVYCYDLARAVKDGFLAPLRAPGNLKTEIDVSGVKRRGGEFVASELELAADKAEIIAAAVDEMIALGKDLTGGWLAFCSGVDHSAHVCAAFRERGISAATVTHKTPSGERDRIFKAFKAQQIRVLCGMDVFTTGFDAPHVVLIGLLRPTLSTRLYVQMLGRGTRLSPGKTECLVADFAGNVRRHGPVDDVDVRMSKKKPGEKPEKTDPDTVRAKICPACQTYNSISAPTCTACGFEWPKDSPLKHVATPDTAPVMKKDVLKWTMLSDTRLDRWQKFGEGADSLVVEYEHARGSFRQWVCFEHTGYARERAEFWWITLGGQRPPPKDINEAIKRAAELHMPVGVHVQKNGKFHEVKEILAERPDGSLIEIDQTNWRVKPHRPEVAA